MYHNHNAKLNAPLLQPHEEVQVMVLFQTAGLIITRSQYKSRESNQTTLKLPMHLWQGIKFTQLSLSSFQSSLRYI